VTEEVSAEMPECWARETFGEGEREEGEGETIVV
jgi:hypothetical protein